MLTLLWYLLIHVVKGTVRRWGLTGRDRTGGMLSKGRLLLLLLLLEVRSHGVLPKAGIMREGILLWGLRSLRAGVDLWDNTSFRRSILIA